ncbi:hypothetical protein AX16_005692 [Volvariella volvacea WC 439]|nr:hypothetical protein AX16_005692 [Volvariella volvacea WC 439]
MATPPPPSETPTEILRTRKDLLEHIVLKHARYKPPATATTGTTDAASLAAHRQSVLDDPTTPHRLVFQRWPRAPGGKAITPDNSCAGRTAVAREPLWGASLFDLYTTSRVPGMWGVVTYSSGSKLARWARENGEAEYAAEQVRIAEGQEEPRVVRPYPVGRLIEDLERVSVPWEEGGKENPYRDRCPKLEHYIPQHLLPKKLVVHDTGNLLRASSRYKKEGEEVIRVYKLKSTQKAREKADEEQERADIQAEKDARAAFLKDPHSSREVFPGGWTVFMAGENEMKEGPATPPICLVFPPKERVKQPEEAHLYISPSDSIGEGNHSFVYRAVLETPRSYLVDNDPPCTICALEALQRALDEQDGPNGEKRDPKWREKSGRFVWKKKGKPQWVVSTDDEENVLYEIEPSTIHRVLEYEGPYRPIEVDVPQWDPTTPRRCDHPRESVSRPPRATARVHVAAKLSIQHDDHLAREARNYQAFPKDFFEHYNGYQLVPPMIKDPTPVGALVPQYYGYYVLDEEDERNKEREGYLSPILLIEDCGKPINPSTLTVDDINECASLVYRFHNAGWLHNSIYQRNILYQAGPIDEFPLMRATSTTELGRKRWSFRLIDFGRSYREGEVGVRVFREDVFRENSKVTSWLWGHKDLDP